MNARSEKIKNLKFKLQRVDRDYQLAMQDIISLDNIQLISNILVPRNQNSSISTSKKVLTE